MYVLREPKHSQLVVDLVDLRVRDGELAILRYDGGARARFRLLALLRLRCLCRLKIFFRKTVDRDGRARFALQVGTIGRLEGAYVIVLLFLRFDLGDVDGVRG